MVPGDGAVTVAISNTRNPKPGAGVESAAILARVALSPGQGGEGEGGPPGGGISRLIHFPRIASCGGSVAIWQSLMAIWLDLSIWLLANG